MSNDIQLRVQDLNDMRPMEIVTDEKVARKFIQIYDTMWSSLGMSGEAAYERESRAFNRLLGEKEELRSKCTHFSIFTAFLDIAISGLSVEPGARAQAYLMSRSVRIGQDERGQGQFQTQCVLTVSAYGELMLRIRCGQIRHADNPVIVYEEDGFEYGERDGRKFVNYTCRLPHASNRIIAAYMRITRNDGTADYAVLLPADWQRLAAYSSRQNRYYDRAAKQWVEKGANALYQSNDGQPDTGFLTAKLIKHAFKCYPKARVGRGTQLESQQVDEAENEITDDIYGVGAQEAFGPRPDISAGVVVNPAPEVRPGEAATDVDDVF